MRAIETVDGPPRICLRHGRADSYEYPAEQGFFPMSSNEITGMCGRLRCCLIYEYEQYVEARKTLPKRNKRVVTPKGEGKVIDILPMSDKIMVLIESGTDRPQMTTIKRFTGLI